MKGRGKWSPDSFCILKFSSTPFFRVLEVPPHLIPHSLFLFFFLLRQGLRLGSTQSCYVGQIGLKLMVLWAQAPTSWNYRHIPPCLCLPFAFNKAPFLPKLVLFEFGGLMDLDELFSLL